MREWDEAQNGFCFRRHTRCPHRVQLKNQNLSGVNCRWWQRRVAVCWIQNLNFVRKESAVRQGRSVVCVCVCYRYAQWVRTNLMQLAPHSWHHCVWHGIVGWAQFRGCRLRFWFFISFFSLQESDRVQCNHRSSLFCVFCDRDRDQRQTPAANLALVLLGNQLDRRRFMISVRKPNLCWAAIRKAWTNTPINDRSMIDK